MMHHIRIGVLALALTALSAMAWAPVRAVAQERPSPSEWSFQLTPYVWMAGMGGTIRPTATSPSVAMDSSFSDILKNLSAAAFVSGIARRDRFVLLGDLSYTSLSADGEVSPGVSATGKERQTTLTLLGGYKAVDTPDMTVDVLGGLRTWDIRVSANAPAAGVSASTHLSIADPVIAARLHKELAPQWSAVVYGDVGGFGVDSKSTWQAVGTVNYNVQGNFYVSAGYRYLALDYRRDGTLIDIKMHGPLLGLTWRF